MERERATRRLSGGRRLLSNRGWSGAARGISLIFGTVAHLLHRVPPVSSIPNSEGECASREDAARARGERDGQRASFAVTILRRWVRRMAESIWLCIPAAASRRLRSSQRSEIRSSAKVHREADLAALWHRTCRGADRGDSTVTSGFHVTSGTDASRLVKSVSRRCRSTR